MEVLLQQRPPFVGYGSVGEGEKVARLKVVCLGIDSHTGQRGAINRSNRSVELTTHLTRIGIEQVPVSIITIRRPVARW